MTRCKIRSTKTDGCHPFNLKDESSICSHIFMQNVHSVIVQFTILHSRLRILQVCINVPLRSCTFVSLRWWQWLAVPF